MTGESGAAQIELQVANKGKNSNSMKVVDLDALSETLNGKGVSLSSVYNSLAIHITSKQLNSSKMQLHKLILTQEMTLIVSNAAFGLGQVKCIWSQISW